MLAPVGVAGLACAEERTCLSGDVSQKLGHRKGDDITCVKTCAQNLPERALSSKVSVGQVFGREAHF